jgi:hypothetical protein
MATMLKEASYESKTEFNLPEGAEIVKKDVRVNVEEIENGYLICKSFDIKYTLDGESNWEYYSKKWFSKENPIDIDDDTEEMISLADKFED